MTMVVCNSKEMPSEEETSSASPEPCRALLEDFVPEGGWGWFIVVTIATCKVATAGVLPFIAIIFKSEITSNTEYAGSSVTFLVSVFFLVCEATGYFYPNLSRKFSLRTIGCSGGILLIVGSLASVFAVTIPQLAFTYGVLQGGGYGLMLSSSVNAFNQYFRRRATTAMAAAQFATSALALGLPHGVQAALDGGGERAARALVVALAVAAAAAQLLVRGRPPAPAHAHAHALQPLKKDDEANTHEDMLPQIASSNCKKNARTLLRGCALGAWRHLGFSQRPLRAAAVWGPAVGSALAHVGDSNFFALLPLHLSNVGFQKEDVTRAIAAANTGDAVGRFALIVVGLWLSGRNRHIFAVSSAGTTICVLGISWLVSWEAVLAFSALLGFFRGMMYVALFLVFAEIVQPNLFPSALSLFFFFVFVASLIMAPLIGLVRDATRSYPASFCLVAALCALYPVAWPAHALWRRCARGRRGPQVSPLPLGRTDAYQQVADVYV